MTYTDTFNLRDADLINIGNIADAIDQVTTATGPLNVTAWTPTFGVVGTGTPTLTAITVTASYCQIGKIMFVMIRCFGTTGGSTVTEINITLPVNVYQTGGCCGLYEGSATMPNLGTWYTGSGTNMLYVQRDDGASLGIGSGRGFVLNTFLRTV